MQAISKGKHLQLMNALLQLEQLMSYEKHGDCLQQSEAYRHELATIYHHYEQLLDELAEQISAYEVLSGNVKIQFLSRQLKALKKEISVEMPAFPVLLQNIRSAYGT